MRNRKQRAVAKNSQRNGRKKAPSRAMALTAREPKKSQAVKSVGQRRAKTLRPKEAATPPKTDVRSTNLSKTNRSERNHSAEGAQSIFACQMQLLDLLIKWSPLSIFFRRANARA